MVKGKELLARNEKGRRGKMHAEEHNDQVRTGIRIRQQSLPEAPLSHVADPLF